MSYFKLIIIFIILLISSCSENVQNNGLSMTKINQINIKIGETTKSELRNKYGPPVFESVFNKNVIYYVSHKSGYLNFNPRATKELVVLEITFNNKNIVKGLERFSEKDVKQIDISKMTSRNQDNRFLFFKDLINNINRKNVTN